VETDGYRFFGSDPPALHADQPVTAKVKPGRRCSGTTAQRRVPLAGSRKLNAARLFAVVAAEGLGLYDG
jgi:hypothetical protein